MSALLSHWLRTLIYRCADQIAVRLPKEPAPEGVKVGAENTLSPRVTDHSIYWNASSELPRRLIGKVGILVGYPAPPRGGYIRGANQISGATSCALGICYL
jgi:hypothetical protein